MTRIFRRLFGRLKHDWTRRGDPARGPVRCQRCGALSVRFYPAACPGRPVESNPQRRAPP